MGSPGVGPMLEEPPEPSERGEMGELNAPPRLGGCRVAAISLGLFLRKASVTFLGLKLGTPGWLA